MFNLQFIDFVHEHSSDDCSSLVLGRSKYPGIDVALAAECIESRRRLMQKCPLWAGKDIVCPRSLSAEQCSSQDTAGQKARIAAEILGGRKGRVADLTSGLGVDCAALASVCDRVLYNDMNPLLVEAAKHNFQALGIGNVLFSNREVSAATLPDILDEFKPDLVFLDPARRDNAGRKVFRLKDCTPDLTELLPVLEQRGVRALVKVSPMADISQLSRELGSCLEKVYVLGTGSECKELLLELQPGHQGEYRIVKGDMSFTPTEEASAKMQLAERIPEAGEYLFEPDKLLMKAGCYKLLSQKWGVDKLGTDVHIYCSREPLQALQPHGSWHRIVEVLPFDKRSMKEISARYTHSELLSRGLPLGSDALRGKMKLGDGRDARIYALNCGRLGNFFLITVC